MASPQDFADIDLTGRTIGEYKIMARLGKGGMGIVYRALKLGSVSIPVALKYPLIGSKFDTQEALERFQREREILSSVHQHPLIISMSDEGDHEIDGLQVPYYTMPFVHGVTLRELLAALHQDDARLPFECSAYLISQILQVLDFLHHTAMEDGVIQKVIHRDISPDNFIVQLPHGAIQLIDFGVASMISEKSIEPSPVGKSRYMSPEAIEQGDNTTKMDIWSAGVVLWEMLHGRSFLGGLKNSAQVIHAIMAHNLSPCDDDIPEGLAALVESMLSADPAHRPDATFAEFELRKAAKEADIDVNEGRTALKKALTKRYGSGSSSGKTEAVQAAKRRLIVPTSTVHYRPDLPDSKPSDFEALPTMLVPEHESDFEALPTMIRSPLAQARIDEAIVPKTRETDAVSGQVDDIKTRPEIHDPREINFPQVHTTEKLPPPPRRPSAPITRPTNVAPSMAPPQAAMTRYHPITWVAIVVALIATVLAALSLAQ